MSALNIGLIISAGGLFGACAWICLFAQINHLRARVARLERILRAFPADRQKGRP